MTSPFKPFDEMTPRDYEAIGLKCGLEVHQQLLTDRKLFCRCPAGRYSSAFDAEVLRHMRPTLSELGEYDPTALMEKKTRKNIYYRIHHATVCTYEFDDTPPFFPDDRAIDIALEIALLVNLGMVGEMHIARKQYLDGSIPAGFQRTAILGVNGWIPYRDRRIGIRQLSLEEDSCREVSDVGHDRVCLTDRLGMPLIEVVTEPDMRTPIEAAEVCRLISLICRSTGKVRTGYGATREDVNVSVRGGTRIEIKGVPQITRIPLLVYNEAQRQCSLLRIRGLLADRGVTPATFEWSVNDVTSALVKVDYPPIRAALSQGQRVKCVVLRGFAGMLKEPTQEHTTFAKEFSDRVRVIACLTELPNIVHSDTAADLLSARTWKRLRGRTGAAEKDALVLVWGDEQDTATACSEIVVRATEATEGVPPDTRQAHKDGTTGFERVLPGAERMYPDTDLPPMAIAADRVERIRRQLPVCVWERKERLLAMGLPADVVEPLCISPRAGLFERITSETGVDPTFASVVLVQRFTAMRREGLDPTVLADEAVEHIFAAYAEGRLAREGVCEALRRLLRPRVGGDENVTTVAVVVAALVGEPVSGVALDQLIDVRLADVDEACYSTAAKKYRSLMGGLMRELIGRVEGREVSLRLGVALGMPCAHRAQEEVGT